MPAGRHGSGAAAAGSSVYVVGGSLTPGGGDGITDQLIMFSLP
jgi:Kelch motif